MVPRLGARYGLEIETTSRTREDYRKPEYAASGRPMAPALAIGDEVLVQGGDIEEDKVEAAIRRRLAAT